MQGAISSGHVSTRATSQVIQHRRWFSRISNLSTAFVADYEGESGRAWTRWSPCGVPVSNVDLLRDLERASRAIECYFSGHPGTPPATVPGACLENPDVFNLGGDLGYFQRLIAAQDRAGLTEYARSAIGCRLPQLRFAQPSWCDNDCFDPGRRVGRRFEWRAVCDVVVAEKNAKAGFPEVLFNMFPGMGGMSFLARRVGKRVADEMVRTGRLYAAERTPLSLGLIDYVVDTGEGPGRDTEAHSTTRSTGEQAHIANECSGPSNSPRGLQELHEIVQLWVDCAVRLEPR